jgi:hypothetical protein
LIARWLSEVICFLFVHPKGPALSICRSVMVERGGGRIIDECVKMNTMDKVHEAEHRLSDLRIKRQLRGSN